MTDAVFVDRRKAVKRSFPEVIIAVAAVVGLIISMFTGLRAFYVNEYRVDLLEANVKEVRADVKEARTDIKELDRSVQRLVGTVIKNGWMSEEPQNGRKHH